jgi:hypothetical protein
MIEAGAPSTGEVARVMARVCPPHRDSHIRTTEGPAQRGERPSDGRAVGNENVPNGR